MPQVINIKALIVDTVTVNVELPDGSIKTFELKDDIPMEVGLQTFALMQQANFLQHLNETNPTELTQQFALLDTNTSHILGEIFRHTYPDVTDDELTALIPINARLELVKSFFSNLMRQFSKPPSTTDSSTSTSPAETPPAIVDSSNSTSQDETSSPSDSNVQGEPPAA